MLTALLHAHSGLRFLVLLLGVVNALVLSWGLLQKQAFSRMHRLLNASFVGALHLQVVLGLVAVAMGRWFPALAGHIAMMIVAAVAAQAAISMNRRKATPGLRLPLMGVAIALLCIVAGVMAIGRGLFTVSVAAL